MFWPEHAEGTNGSGRDSFSQRGNDPIGETEAARIETGSAWGTARRSSKNGVVFRTGKAAADTRNARTASFVSRGIQAPEQSQLRVLCLR